MDFRVTSRLPDPDWDDFLRISEHGSHQQSSLWAAVKRTQDWDAFRVVAEDGGGIAGGVQVLHRRAWLLGRIGYIKFGPVTRDPNTGFAGSIVSEAIRAARNVGISVLYLQSARGLDEVGSSACETGGFRRSMMDLSLPTTSVIRLDQSEEALLAGMRKSTRRNVRHGPRQGLTLRDGSEADLDAFIDLLEATGLRLGFDPEARAFYHELWRWFSPAGDVHLILAEHEKELIAGTLLVAFGRTVRCFRGGWSGSFANLRPNDQLMWSAIRWAKANGYAYFDQDGTRAGENDSASSFKEGFGGETVPMPPTFEWVRNPMFNAVTFAVPRIGRVGFAKSLFERRRRQGAVS